MSNFVRIAPELYETDAFGDFVAEPAFRLGNARALMWLSQAAYQLEDFADFRRRGLFEAWGLETAEGFDRKGLTAHSSGFLALRPDAAFLVFAGTDPVRWRTVLTDALALQARRGEVHLGFWRAFESIAGDMRQMLARIEGRKLFVAGHSLGGALAVLAARFAAGHGAKPATVYAFGLPRVGGPAFARRYNSELGEVTYRLVLGEDFAARLPASTLPLPGGRTLHYRHVGRLLACRPGELFDAANLSPDPSGDDPPWPSARQLVELNWAARGAPAPDPGYYTGAKAVFNRLRPASLRHHMQDQYLHALRPAPVPQSR